MGKIRAIFIRLFLAKGKRQIEAYKEAAKRWER